METITALPDPLLLKLLPRLIFAGGGEKHSFPCSSDQHRWLSHHHWHYYITVVSVTLTSRWIANWNIATLYPYF